MNWLFYAGGAVLFFTTLNLLQRQLATDSNNPRAMAVLFNLIAGVFALFIFLITKSYKGFSLPVDKLAWIFLVIAALMYALFERGRFLAAKLLDASTLIIIMNIYVVVSFVGSIFLYSESLTIPKVMGALLILISLVLVSYEKTNKRKVSFKGVLITVLISTCLGIGGMLDKKGAFYFTSDTYNILIWTVPILFIVFPFVKINDVFSELKKASWKVFVLAGINVVGYLSQLKAFEIQEATKVIPIVQTSTLLTVLLGILILKERNNIIRKIISGVLALLGIILIIG